jgi:kynurenine 3-monooxygenase
MKDKQALIIGGGLVGALWAVFMAKRGYQVDVYERRGDMRLAGYSGGRSINLAMSHRGWRAVEKAGILDEIREVAIPMHGRMMHSPEGALTYQPYGKDGEAIYSVSRGGLNLALLEIADRYEQVRFHFHQKCVFLDPEEGLARFEHTQTGAITAASSPLIFGTDGAFSAVRECLQNRPRFNFSQDYLDYGYKELTIPPVEGKHAMEVNALHIWPRGKFMLIALPNVDGSFTCTLFLPFEGEFSFENLHSEKQITDFFQRFFGDAASLMPSLLDDFQQNPTSALATMRCNPWNCGSKVLLLGDAAHAIVPFFGQGMNAGFEDCTILDSMLEQAGENWDAVIPAFSRQRVPDANAIADLALQNFIEMRDLVADPDFLLRKRIAAALAERWPDAFMPMYSMVSFSHVPYREALEAGRAQEVLLGQLASLPDIESNLVDHPDLERLFWEWKSIQDSKTL